MVLSAILFCLILLLCIISFLIGFSFGLKGCKPKENKKPPDELTEEQKLAIEKAKRETENFWNYTGDNQETET